LAERIGYGLGMFLEDGLWRCWNWRI
jgi:hypothetical protein